MHAAEITTSWLLWIPLLPLAGAVVNGGLALLGRPLDEAKASLLGCATVAASAVLATAAFFLVLSHEEPVRLVADAYTWIQSGRLEIPIRFAVDRLSALMLLVVCWVGLLIHVYSRGYMHGDEGFARFFTYLNLFMFSMLVLVLGASLPVLFVGWEGVGLCSYLLIGFWFTDIKNAQAGKKAFVVNRIGDFGFLLGMFVLFWGAWKAGAPTLDIQGLAALADKLGEQSITLWGFSMRLPTVAGLLLFVGACGKSAQIPLYVWLPDAMAGPTPVSALIHAATMVTAGVYMTSRMHFLYEASPVALTLIALVGALTAFFAATIALVQNDIKKVLAYSTVSQLGYMFLGVGSGAFAAGVFHLYTHAFFKACLFLGAGSVMHGLSNNTDIRVMGGLRKKMPHTWMTFGLSTLAIAGVPGLAGFFSKDEILWKAFSNANFLVPPLIPGHEALTRCLPLVLWSLGAVTALCTAFYMGRLFFLTFHGESRTPHDIAHHTHESPAAMTAPLWILAAGAVLAGYAGVPHFLGGSNRIEHWLGGVFEGHAAAEAAAGHADLGRLEPLLAGVSALIGVGGLCLAYLFYIVRPKIPGRIARVFARLYRVLLNKYYVDEAYEAAVVEPVRRASESFLWKIVDVKLIDGLVRGLGAASRAAGRALSAIENGFAGTYAVGMLLGTVLILSYLALR